LFNPDRLYWLENKLRFLPVDENGIEVQARYLPVETIENIYCLGSLDANSTMYNLLGKHHIAVHLFDYYEYSTGSFMPKEYSDR
jgi:CRISP-associated protein Cas1